MVVAVVNELKSALGAVDDMQQWLTVLNLKMQHMRDDIAAIEQRNNALEIQSNNEQLLLKELQALLETIDTPPSLKDIGEIEALSLEVCCLVLIVTMNGYGCQPQYLPYAFACRIHTPWRRLKRLEMNCVNGLKVCPS